MARTGIIFGLLLCGLTCAALILSTVKSPSQFIPMMIGIPTLFCSVVALNPHRRKQAMRAAASLALLGALVGGIRSLALLSDSIRDQDLPRYLASVNTTLCLLSCAFLAIWLVDYVQQRRRRHQQRSRSFPLRKGIDQP